MTTLREAAQQALGILCSEFTTVDGEFCRWCDGRLNAKHNCALEQTITALRAALAQQENKTPITDDHGKALLPQYQVIEQSGNWLLLYDQMQVGEKVRHEFRIQKLRHDVALYPGITLAEAQKRFRERVEADNE